MTFFVTILILFAGFCELANRANGFYGRAVSSNDYALTAVFQQADQLSERTECGPANFPNVVNRLPFVSSIASLLPANAKAGALGIQCTLRESNFQPDKRPRGDLWNRGR